MLEKYKGHLDLIPKVIPLIYIMGFIGVNAYLGNYSISENNLLSFSYLKVGLLVSVLLGINYFFVLISHTNETVTDNILKSWKGSITSLSNILYLTFVEIIMMLVNWHDFRKSHQVLCLLFPISFFVALIYKFQIIDKRIPKNNIEIAIVNIIYIAILIFMNMLFISISGVSYLLFFNLFLCVLFNLSLGLIGDKKHFDGFWMFSIGCLSQVVLFGSLLYGMIPSTFGGGKPYSIIIEKRKDIKDSISLKTSDTLTVLYENNERYLLMNKNGKIDYIIKSELPDISVVK